jgi:hypothetical protein
LNKIAGDTMDYSTVERRRHQRHEPQQQPQQSAVDATAAKPAKSTQESPRKTWQEQANAQARRQSGKL